VEQPAAHVNIGWEAAQALGAATLLGCLLLCLLPVRPRAFGSQTVSLRRHAVVAWIALAAAALHVALLPAVDRTVVEYLKPTAPGYLWAGFLALLLLLMLTVPATGALRRRLWSRHRDFQALHVGMACLLIAGAALHVVTTDRYVHGRARAVACIVLAAAALLALLRARLPADSPERPREFLDSLVFGRHSALVLAVVVVAAVAVFTPLSRPAALALREPLFRRAVPLTVDFPHERHREIDCVRCHHNFIDRTGDGACYLCHRSPKVKVGIEARFHDFCLGCHRHPPPGLTHHGPVTGCDTCHQPLPVQGSAGSQA
jgi:Class III cytochrome C family